MSRIHVATILFIVVSYIAANIAVVHNSLPIWCANNPVVASSSLCK